MHKSRQSNFWHLKTHLKFLQPHWITTVLRICDKRLEERQSILSWYHIKHTNAIVTRAEPSRAFPAPPTKNISVKMWQSPPVRPSSSYDWTKESSIPFPDITRRTYLMNLRILEYKTRFIFMIRFKNTMCHGSRVTLQRLDSGKWSFV